MSLRILNKIKKTSINQIKKFLKNKFKNSNHKLSKLKRKCKYKILKNNNNLIYKHNSLIKKGLNFLNN